MDDADDGQVEAFGFRTGDGEAQGIARICRQLVEEADIQPGGILVLLRNDPRGVYSEPIIQALEAEGLGAELPVDPFALLDEDDPRQLVCLLRLLRDREDGLAWRELIKLRPNRVGDGSLMAVYRLADERGQRYAPTLQAIADDPDILDHRMRNRIAEEVREINELLDNHADLLDAPAVGGLDLLLSLVEFADDDEREEVAGLLLGLTAEGDDEQSLGDVEAALHTSRGRTDEEERTGDRDRVQIMSMHSAKGLTADAVIVAACEEELIPGETEDRRDLDDQRRLLYVSLTRARHYLLVTYARSRPGQQSHLLQVATARTYTSFLRDYLAPNGAA